MVPGEETLPAIGPPSTSSAVDSTGVEAYSRRRGDRPSVGERMEHVRETTQQETTEADVLGRGEGTQEFITGQISVWWPTTRPRCRRDPASAGLPAVPQQHPAAPDQGSAARRPGERSSCGRRASATATSHALESDLTIQHNGEPIGERMVVTGRVLDGDGRPVRRPAGRDLAGERGRSLHPQARPAPGADRPELHRRRSLPDRRRRELPVHHDQAGPVPVEEPPQRLAAGAHPLLLVRHGLHPADDHPDVLPGRPAVRAGPDLPVDRRPAGPRPAGRHLRPRRDPARVGTGYRWDIVLTGSQRTWMEPEEEDHA